MMTMMTMMTTTTRFAVLASFIAAAALQSVPGRAASPPGERAAEAMPVPTTPPVDVGPSPLTPPPPPPPPTALVPDGQQASPVEAVTPALGLLDDAAKIVEEGDNTVPLLQRAIESYESSIKDITVPRARRAKALIDLSRAQLRLGDLLTKPETRTEIYARGRKSAQQAQALDRRSADAVYLDGANLVRALDARGAAQASRGAASSVREATALLRRALQLDPHHAYAKQTLAMLLHALPRAAGGNDGQARALLLAVLAHDPDFTAARVALARLDADLGHRDEARAHAQQVLDAQRATLPNDYRKLDVVDARKVIESLDAR